jgi:hypothetical protein
MGEDREWSVCRLACGTSRLEELCETTADCPVIRYSDGTTKPDPCYAPPESTATPPWMKYCLLP